VRIESDRRYRRLTSEDMTFEVLVPRKGLSAVRAEDHGCYCWTAMSMSMDEWCGK
jgi:hypothetical protein